MVEEVQTREKQQEPLPDQSVLFGALQGSGYVTRLLVCTAACLIVAGILANLPYYSLPEPIGWRVVRTEEKYTLEDLKVDLVSRIVKAQPEIIAEDHSKPPGESNLVESGKKSEYQPLILADPQEDQVPEHAGKIRTRAAIFEYTEDMPEIVGGVGAYYIKIVYPEDAARAGIQGRLILDFVVEPDGYPSNIRVLNPVYPSCDSAAVQALRLTRFVPGTSRGEYVRIRMRLPVRFQLIEKPVPAAPTGTMPLTMTTPGSTSAPVTKGE